MTRKSPRSHRQRSGYSLIECLATLTGVLVLLGLSVGLIHQLLRLDRSQRDRLVEVQAFSGLARALRGDLHRASATPIVTPARLQVPLGPEGEAIYVLKPGTIERTETRPGRPVRRERYAVAPHAGLRFESGTMVGRPSISLISQPDPNAVGAGSRNTPRIDAIVGRDRLRGKE